MFFFQIVGIFGIERQKHKKSLRLNTYLAVHSILWWMDPSAGIFRPLISLFQVSSCFRGWMCSSLFLGLQSLSSTSSCSLLHFMRPASFLQGHCPLFLPCQKARYCGHLLFATWFWGRWLWNGHTGWTVHPSTILTFAFVPTDVSWTAGWLWDADVEPWYLR